MPAITTRIIRGRNSTSPVTVSAANHVPVSDSPISVQASTSRKHSRW